MNHFFESRLGQVLNQISSVNQFAVGTIHITYPGVCNGNPPQAGVEYNVAGIFHDSTSLLSMPVGMAMWAAAAAVQPG
jgi:hypothetical protein